MSVKVEEFDAVTPALVEAMEELRERVYQGDELYEASPVGSLARDLGRPEFQGRQRIFFARRGEVLVACVVGRLTPGLELGGAPAATIGNFDGLDDREAVGSVLRRAVAWAKDEGAEEVVGPMNGDTWHDYRFNMGPFEEPLFLKEPYNREYYPALWKDAGFRLLQEYRSCRHDDLIAAREHNRPRYEELVAAGYTVEPMTESPFEEVVDRVYEMVRGIFDEAYLYTEISREAFGALYAGAEPILSGDLCFFIVDADGEDAGFCFAFPGYARALLMAKARGDHEKLLISPEQNVGNVKTVGVMPAHRGKGMAGAIAYLFLDAMVKKKMVAANHCLMMVGNYSNRVGAEYGREFRRYELYRWAKDDSC